MERGSGWDDVRAGLALVFWGWLAHTLALALGTFLAAWSLPVYGGLFFSTCSLGGLIVATIGLARLLRAPLDARLGVLPVAALACCILNALVESFWLVVSLRALSGAFGGFGWLTFKVWLWLSVVSAAAAGASVILLVLILYTIARRVQALLPFWFGVIVCALAGFKVLAAGYAAVAGESFRVPVESPWLWLFLTAGMLIAQNALLLLLVANTRQTLAGGAQVEADWEGAAGWFGSPEWQRPTRGVGLYAAALKALLLIIVGGYGTVLAAGLVGVPLLAVVAAIGIPIGVLITQVVMIIGLAGYATVPLKSGARGLALAALAAHALAVLLDVLSIVAVIAAAAGETEYAYEAQRALARAHLISGFAQVTGLTGFVLLLLSFARAARFVGAAELARKGTPILIMVITTAAAVLLLRAVLNSPRIVGNAGPGLLALAVGVVFLALTSLVMYLNFVNKLHGVLVEGPPEVAPATEAWG